MGPQNGEPLCPCDMARARDWYGIDKKPLQRERVFEAVAAAQSFLKARGREHPNSYHDWLDVASAMLHVADIWSKRPE